MKKFVLLLFPVLCFSSLYAQLERKPANTELPVELTFHAPRHINLATVEPLENKTFHLGIMHTFGTVDGGLESLFGLDNGANIQIVLEYGLSERLSLGASRSSRDKVYYAFGRYHLLRQMQDNSMPLSLSVMAGAGVITGNYDFLGAAEPDFSDRQVYSAQVMLARKFSDKFSFQVTPMLAVFSNPLSIYSIQSREDWYGGLGLSGKIRLSPKTSLTLQGIPGLHASAETNYGLGVDIEAGGHVFQLYLVTSQMLNEPYLLAGDNGQPLDGFRFGFNVNRVFAPW
jgi:hypothetical protein